MLLLPESLLVPPPPVALPAGGLELAARLGLLGGRILHLPSQLQVFIPDALEAFRHIFKLFLEQGGLAFFSQKLRFG